MRTLSVTDMEAATLLSLVGLAVAVMQNNEEQGREFISALAQPGIEATARSLVEKCSNLLEEPPSELVS